MSDKPEYYVLTPVYRPKVGEFSFVNASVGICGLCGGIATSMGGSNHDICIRCAEVVIRGQARGTIIWEDNDAPAKEEV